MPKFKMEALAVQAPGCHVPFQYVKDVTIPTSPITICVCMPWVFSSCASTALQSFKSYGWIAKATKEDIDAFVDFLLDPHEHAVPNNGYCSSEVYFQLSTYQLASGHFNLLIGHDKCRQIDKYKNKAHGPNFVHLFRLSFDKDFQS